MYVYVYVYEGWPISPILVAIEIEIEIGIGIGIGIPSLVGTWAAQVMSHRTILRPPLALLASWRLNSPAFTHPADGIESKWTVHRAGADPMRGTAKTPRTPRGLRAWRRAS